MKHQLHIQLGRTSRTTHHSRSLVWLRVCLFVLLLAGTAQIMFVWLNKNTVFIAAPDDVSTAIQLHINAHTIPILKKTLGNIPLISNRDITLEDLLPFTHGQLAWFFHQDGTRSIAIRSTQSEIPTTILDSKHIIVQKVEPNVLLLSEKLQPISGISNNMGIQAFIPTFDVLLGSYFEKGFTNTQKITATKDQLHIPIPKNLSISSTNPTLYTPEGVYLVLSTPVLSNIFHIQGITRTFASLADPLLSESLGDIVNKLMDQNQMLALIDTKPTSFLLVSSFSPEFDKRSQLIRTILALTYPTTQQKTLSDGSILQEIAADPSLISLAEQTIEGKAFLQASSATSKLFISKDDQFIFSNSEETIRSWLQRREQQSTTPPLCDSNAGYINVDTFLQSEASTLIEYSQDIMFLIAQHFQSIGLANHKNLTTIHLCF